VFTCACALDVDREPGRYAARLPSAERRRIGTRRDTRLPTPFTQALLALARLRDRPDVQRLGAGYSLPRSTAHRYPDKTRRAPTDQTPNIKEALNLAAARGHDGAGCGILTPAPQHGRQPLACRHAHPQQPTTKTETSRRTRLPPADRTLESTRTPHHEPEENHPDHQSSPRADPIRAQTHQLIPAEITSQPTARAALT
jgi:hypothetical protein